MQKLNSSLNMNLNLLLFITLLLMPLSGLGIDLFTPSLPAIAEHFKVHDSLARSTISVYLFGFIFGQIIFGIPSDFLGRRRLLFLSIILFFVASIVAPFSPNMALLLILRAIQGFGTGGVSVITKTLITDSFSGKKLATNMTYLAISWGLGPVIAPAIGGYLQYYFNWYASFYFYSIYSGILILLILFFLKETNLKTSTYKMKIVFNNFRVVFTHKNFIGGVLCLGFAYSLIIVFNVLGPFLIQKELSYSPIMYGHMALLIGAAFFLGTLSTRFLMTKFNPDLLIKIGILVMSIINVIFIILPYVIKLNLFIIVVPVFLIIYFTGIIFPLILGKSTSFFLEKAGTANAILGALLTVCSFSSSFVASFLPGKNLLSVAWFYLILLVLLALSYFVLLKERITERKII